MVKQTHYNFSILSRFFVFFLCFLLLFCLVARPITAHASATATIAIGAYGVIKVIASAKVLVGLIIGGFAGFLIEPLINETDEWYNSDPVIRNWSNQYAGKINGGEVISIPSDVQTAIRQRYMLLNDISLSYLYVPYDLTHLEHVTSAHLFGQDVAAQLEANNTLLQRINSSLIDLNTNISLVPSLVVSSLSSSLSSIISSTEAISRTVSQYSNMVQNSVEGITSTLNQQMNMLRSGVDSLTSTVNQQMNMLRSGVDSLNEVEGLRRSFYELLEVFGDLKRSRSSSKK